MHMCKQKLTEKIRLLIKDFEGGYFFQISKNSPFQEMKQLQNNYWMRIYNIIIQYIYNVYVQKYMC